MSNEQGYTESLAEWLASHLGCSASQAEGRMLESRRRAWRMSASSEELAAEAVLDGQGGQAEQTGRAAA